MLPLEPVDFVHLAVNKIISPGLSYDDSLSMFNMASLEDRRIDQCEKLFDSIVSNPDHKLHHFLPPKNYCHYTLIAKSKVNKSDR